MVDSEEALFDDLQNMERRLAVYATTTGYLLGQGAAIQRDFAEAQERVRSAKARLERLAALVPELDDIARRSSGSHRGDTGQDDG